MTTPKSKKSLGPTPVEAITHVDKRANIPTADNQDFVSPEMERPVPVRYPRDPSLDPQLVWKGKDELDGEDLVSEAPAIYIQEKINPRVLIENLRQTAARSEQELEFTLFDDFDGLPALDQVEFYQHESNWSNRMILGDSLNVMSSLAEREALRGKVQMVYLDPPYGIKFGSNWQASARKRDVKDGKLSDASREVEQIKAFRDTWELGIHSYLTYLRDRLVVARDLLTDSGSIFVQIGDDNAHLVRSLLDEIFGPENYCSTITIKKTSSASSPSGRTDFPPSIVDYVLWYGRDKGSTKSRPLYESKFLDGAGGGQYTWVELPNGERRRLKAGEAAPANARAFRISDLTSQTAGDSTVYPLELEGKTFYPGNRGWSTHQEGMERFRIANRLLLVGNTPCYVRFFDDFPVMPLTNQWNDTVTSGFAEAKSYVVQTHPKVIERCILLCTDPGDLILDPTCGSGTTALVAEQWGRRWITIDTSRVALALARQRIMGAKLPYYLLSDSDAGRKREAELTGGPLIPSQTSGDVRHGFVYGRLPRINMKSIANNPDVAVGLTERQLREVVLRHADSEILYDKPNEDVKKVRVAGPFSVESLSPHRSLSFAGSAIDGSGSLNSQNMYKTDDDASSEQTILANLRAAGIQNGRKNERLVFDSLEPYAGVHIQAIGRRDDAEGGAAKTVGITIGPQFGTVGPGFIKDAAREANRAGDLDLLCVLGFAFDPAALGQSKDYFASDEGFANVAAERKLGRVPVLLVRMNSDLVMGEELKKTGAGNLFTVFGEPDIEIKADGDELRVVLKGVDVYDPNTGELRSNDVSQIALWMIDTAYSEESFFVRHCYFTGGLDPLVRLKRALKADIDAEAWASMYRTESRPFSRPESGKIAVKVINDYGDEVVKVFSV